MDLSITDYKKIIRIMESTVSFSSNISIQVQTLLAKLFNFNHSLFWRADEKGNMYNLDFYNFDEKAMIDYAETYNDADVMHPRKLLTKVINNNQHIITIEDITTPTKFTQSAYYEYVKKHQLIDQMVMYFSNESFIYAGIGFARFKGEESFTYKEKSILKTLSTHLQQIFQRPILMKEIKANRLKELLSKRETEVYNFVLKGYTNEQISAELWISINTVKKHLRNMYDKIGVSNRTGLIYKLKQ